MLSSTFQKYIFTKPYQLPKCFHYTCLYLNISRIHSPFGSGFVNILHHLWNTHCHPFYIPNKSHNSKKSPNTVKHQPNNTVRWKCKHVPSDLRCFGFQESFTSFLLQWKVNHVEQWNLTSCVQALHICIDQHVLVEPPWCQVEVGEDWLQWFYLSI